MQMHRRVLGLMDVGYRLYRQAHSDFVDAYRAVPVDSSTSEVDIHDVMPSRPIRF